MGVMATWPGVDLMATGTWDLRNGKYRFTRKDLADAIDATVCPAVGDPVIKLGHTDPRFDGEPAMGRVRNMRLDGDRLTGDLWVPEWLSEDTAAAAYPQRSIEGARNFTCQIGHKHPFVVTHLALLGVTRPGIGGLNNLDDLKALVGASARHYGQWWTYPEDEGTGDVTDPTSPKAIRAAIREGRLTERGAAAMLEARITAHSHQQALKQAHEALDRGHPASYSEDEFARLFNPGSKGGPLGPDDEEEGHVVAPRSRGIVQQGDGTRASWDGYSSSGAPLSDDPDDALYDAWPPGRGPGPAMTEGERQPRRRSRDKTWDGYTQASAPYTDEDVYDALFGHGR